MQQPVICCYEIPAAGEQQSCAGKFLQLVWRGRAYLLFAPESVHRYHNQILGRFLTEHRISHEWVDGRTLVPRDPALTVHGGRRFLADNVKRTLTLWDNSQAYGRFDERSLAGQLAAARHSWHDYRLRIR